MTTSSWSVSRSLFYFHSKLGTKRTRLSNSHLIYLGFLIRNYELVSIAAEIAACGDMYIRSLVLVIVTMAVIGESSQSAVLTFIHDLVQNNVAGPPIVHQHTEWDFDPEQGKARRARYESLNGRYGQDLIDRLGMGMGFKGSWGKKVSGTVSNGPAIRLDAESS